MREPWEAVPLGDLVDIFVSNVDKHILPGEMEVQLCNYLHVYRNRRLTHSLNYDSGSATSGEIARFKLKQGDVVITKDSETPDDIGVPAVVIDDLTNTICGYHLALLRPKAKKSVDSRFLCLCLQGETTKRHFLRYATGVTRFGLSIRAIASLSLPALPLAEQVAIANIIDDVDSGIERTRVALERARELDHALLHDLLENGVTGRREKGKPNWPVHRVDEVAEVGSGVTLGKDVSGFKYVELPYLRVANVQDGHLDLSTIKTVKVRTEEINNYRLQPGDVLMTEGGDLDKLGRGTIWEGQIPNCLHQNHIFRIRAIQDRLRPFFFALMVESDIAKRYFLRVAKRTTNLASINKTVLRAFRFPVPPLKEQEQIEALMKAVKEMQASLVVKQNALQTLRQSLMYDLLTGCAQLNSKQLHAVGAL